MSQIFFLTRPSKGGYWYRERPPKRDEKYIEDDSSEYFPFFCTKFRTFFMIFRDHQGGLYCEACNNTCGSCLYNNSTLFLILNNP